MITYTATNWYWTKTTGEIYASAKGALVAATDPDYVAWLAAGGRATPWPRDEAGAETAGALDDVLTAAGLPPTGLAVPTPVQLAEYAGAKAEGVIAGGVTINIAAPGDPALLIQVSTEDKYLTWLNGAVQRAGLDPTAICKWQQRGAVATIPLNAAQTKALGLAVQNWAQSILDQLDLFTDAGAAIAAGTVTTFAQIDDPTSVGLPAWPANS